MRAAISSSPFVSRLLLVADPARLGPVLRQRYAGVELCSVPSWMSAIAEMAGPPVHAVLGFVEPSFSALPQAVRGLRLAAGDDVPVVLCCEPTGETLARAPVQGGADDYVVWPPEHGELDLALKLKPSAAHAEDTGASRPPVELAAFGEILADLPAAPHRLARRMAEFVRTQLRAVCVEVTLEQGVRRAGPADAEIVLREPIPGGGAAGEIGLGPPLAGAYGPAEVDRLRQYARLFGHVMEAARRQQYWRQLALSDDLTHLPNRRYLLQFLHRVLDQAARERFRVTVCMFDIDDFKKYNDQFGYDTGDAIIKAMGQLFLRHCRAEDVVARYGGDEFVVVFWDAESPRVAGSDHPDAAIEVMKRFQQSLASYDVGCLGPKGQGVLTISGGLATYPWHGSTAAGLLLQAGQALLEAKRNGKNRIHVVGG
jgi:diguanylate cyclase (GGDEF)-like protein